MRTVIIEALESKRAARSEGDPVAAKPAKAGLMTGPMSVPKRPLGPRLPTDENPHDLTLP